MPRRKKASGTPLPPPPGLDLRVAFPPTNNTYYRHVGPRVLISSRGRKYRQDVADSLAHLGLTPLTGPVRVTAVFQPPDRRRRDLDNLLKGFLDALTFAGVWVDDSQVKHLDVRFGVVESGHGAAVTVTPLEDVDARVRHSRTPPRRPRVHVAFPGSRCGGV